MKSERISFKAAIARDVLRRCWPLWAAYFVYLLISMPVSLLSYIQMNTRAISAEGLRFSLNTKVMSLGIDQVHAAIFVGILTVMILFGYLYSSRGNTLMNSLPVRRESLFLTLYLTGLAPLLLCQALVVLLTAALAGRSGIAGQSYLVWFGCTALSLLFYYGFACFCAMLTGNILVLPAVYAVLNFTAAAFESCVNNCLAALIYGMRSGSLRFSFLSPFVYLSNRLAIVGHEDYSFTFSGMPALAVYAAVGLVFSVLALLLYRRRRMECVSDLVAFPVLKPLFRICMAVGTAFVCSSCLYSNFFQQTVFGVQAAWVIGGCLVLGAVLGWIAAEMLIRRSVQIFPMPWKGLAVVCVCCLFVVITAEADLTGYERRIPDPDRVSCVSISYDNAVFREKENITALEELHQELIDKKALYDCSGTGYMAASVRQMFGEAASSVWVGSEENLQQLFIPIHYELTDGSALTRYYTISFYAEEADDPSTTIGRLAALMNCPEGIRSRMFGEVPVEEQNISYAVIGVETVSGSWEELRLTPQEFLDLWQTAMVPDAEEGKLGLYIAAETEASLAATTNLSIEVLLKLPAESGVSDTTYPNWYSFRVFTFSERCLRWIENNTDLEWVTMQQVRDAQMSW